MEIDEITIREQLYSDLGYEKSSILLNDQLNFWLKKAGSPVNRPARVIIVPHAAYKFSGECAAYAYKEVDPNIVKRIFILGPHHQFNFHGCALAKADFYETPFYNLKVDQVVINEFKETGYFSEIDIEIDKNEYSIEIQLPFIAKIMKGKEFKIVPLYVNSSYSKHESKYSELFSKYLLDPANLFIISTNFCHWGRRFKYQFQERSWGFFVHQSIEKLDKLGMEAIKTCEPNKFKIYLQTYQNTICGREAIVLILCSIQKLIDDNPNLEAKFKLLNYEQSSECKFQRDSSVSYLSASLTISPK